MAPSCPFSSLCNTREFVSDVRQTRTTLSACAEAIWFEFNQATPFTSAVRLVAITTLPSPTFHNRIVLSADPEQRRELSVENLSAETDFSWPANALASLPPGNS